MFLISLLVPRDIILRECGTSYLYLLIFLFALAFGVIGRLYSVIAALVGHFLILFIL